MPTVIITTVLCNIESDARWLVFRDTAVTRRRHPNLHPCDRARMIGEVRAATLALATQLAKARFQCDRQETLHVVAAASHEFAKRERARMNATLAQGETPHYSPVHKTGPRAIKGPRLDRRAA